jgi:AP-4 complex subunit mu-1
MISQFFILSARGDNLIFRDFRSDLSKNSPSIFFREVKTAEREKKPIFEKDGITFAYLKRQSLFIACTTRFNTSPAMLMDMLVRAGKIINDLCGELNEDSIRKNFIMVYEILEEMMDFGFPQIMNTEKVKPFVESAVIQVGKIPKVKKPFFNIFGKDTVVADVTKTGV